MFISRAYKEIKNTTHYIGDIEWNMQNTEGLHPGWIIVG